MVCNLIARLAALTEHRQLLVQHPLELVGRHVRDALVGLQRLQLVQTPVQLLKSLDRQADIGSFFYNINSLFTILSLQQVNLCLVIHLDIFEFPDSTLNPSPDSNYFQEVSKSCANADSHCENQFQISGFKERTQYC